MGAGEDMFIWDVVRRVLSIERIMPWKQKRNQIFSLLSLSSMALFFAVSRKEPSVYIIECRNGVIKEFLRLSWFVIATSSNLLMGACKSRCVRWISWHFKLHR